MLKKVKAETQSRNLGARTWNKYYNTMGQPYLLPFFLFFTQVSSFLIQHRISCLRVVPPTVAWAHLYQWAIKKMPYTHAHGQLILSREFWNWHYYSDNSELWQMKLPRRTLLFSYYIYMHCVYVLYIYIYMTIFTIKFKE